MVDKRIFELSTTAAQAGQFIAIDKAGNVEAEKYSIDNIVQTSGAQTIAGEKTFSDKIIVNTGLSFGLRIGDGDSGLVEISDDNLKFLVGGQTDFGVATSSMGRTATGGAIIIDNLSPDPGPLFTFSGDTDTGLSRPADNELGLVAGGIETLRVTNSQIIVDTSGASIATLNSSVVGGFARVIVSTDDNTTDGQLAFMEAASTKWSIGNNADNDAFVISKGFGAFGTNDFITVLTTGFVGINETIPGYRLDVLETVADDPIIRAKRDTSSGATDGGKIRLENLSSGMVAGATAGAIDFYKNDASVEGAGVVGKISVKTIDAGGTFNLVFETGQDIETPAGDNAIMELTYNNTLKLNQCVGEGGIEINGSPGANKGLRFRNNFSHRWYLYYDSAAESGGNAGSDFRIARYDDAGGFLGAPFIIIRSTGAVFMPDIATGAGSHALRYNSATGEITYN